MTADNTWPGVAQVGFARPTDRLDGVIRFYVDGLGLRELYRFANHAGHDGVMLGPPAPATTWNSPATPTTAPGTRRATRIC
ncbi:hypothetical protein [Nocardia grenadensis]|uniref:hypothetical protein n=1 Tax=Nocardia grenadensis TaxID=931537 RepID=UPI003D7275A1